MKKKKIIIIFLVLFFFLFSINEKTYARYILTRNFDASVSAAPFNFTVSATNTNVVFPRTTSESDFNDILTTKTTFNLVITNNNTYDTTYQVSMVNNEKYTFVEGETITKTISSEKSETIALNLMIKNLESPLKTFKIQVTSTKPYSKSFEFTFHVTQEGAIQTIEDLVNLSLSIRGRSNPGNLTTSDVQKQRFKMTRNLNFQDKTNYENADRTDYNDVNDDEVNKGSLYNELTQEPGFLPIGELSHSFQGVFNGGEYTLSNMLIHKSKQTSIGFFGYTSGATIKNFTIANGDVYNHNQTAGMVIGKMVGGVLDNVNVNSKSVISTDEIHTTEDTYSGGIVGYVTAEATISNCINRATVSTQFTGNASSYSGPAGGITAWMSHSTIKNCKNYGEVSGESYIGGIAGFSGMQLDDGTSDSPGGGTIENCENHGYIHYYDPGGTLPSMWGRHIGGIVGYNKKGGIINSNLNDSDARVQGIRNVGGIVGNNASGGIVTNNTNKSKNITATTTYVGKIVGTGTVGSGNVDAS